MEDEIKGTIEEKLEELRQEIVNLYLEETKINYFYDSSYYPVSGSNEIDGSKQNPNL